LRKCQIYGAEFSTITNKGHDHEFPQKYNNYELGVVTCSTCNIDSTRHGQLDPINGIHIPANHRWACGLHEGPWFGSFYFIGFPGKLKGLYICWDCAGMSDNNTHMRRKGRGMNVINERLRKDADLLFVSLATQKP
jgi:hypothetical protein